MKLFILLSLVWFAAVCWLLRARWRRILSQARRHVWEILSCCGLVFLFLLLNKEVLLGDKYQVISDNKLYTYPFFHYFLDSFAQGKGFPLWNPYCAGGMPSFLYLNNCFLLHVTHLAAYAVYPFISAVQPLRVYWWVLIFDTLFMSAGFYFLLKALFGRWQTALFGVTAFLLGGMAVGVLHVEQISASTLYVPWIWLAVIMYSRTFLAAWWLIACALFGFSLLNHYPQLAVYFWGSLVLAYLVAAPAQALKRIREIASARPSVFWAGVALSAITTAPSVWLYLGYHGAVTSMFRSGSLESGYSFVLSAASTNAVNYHTFLHYLLPKSFSVLNSFTGSLFLGQVEHDNFIFYVGIITVLFAGYGVIKARTALNNMLCVAFISVVALGLGAYSFGYYLLYELIPFADLQRIPLHMAYYFNILITMIAAAGLDYYLSSGFGRPKAEGAGMFVMAGPIINHDMGRALLRSVLDQLSFLALMIAGFVVIIKRKPGRIGVTILFLLLLGDLGGYYHIVFNAQKEPVDQQIPQSQAKYTWQARAYHKPPANDSYWSLVSGTAYIDTQEKTHRQLVVFKDYYDFLSKNNDFLTNYATYSKGISRAYLVPAGKTAEAQDKGLAFLEKFDAAPAIKNAYYEPDAMRFIIDTAAASRFVVLDNFDGGWKASVDGAGAPVLRFASFKSIDIPAGRHEVAFSYSPAWRFAVYSSLLALVLTLAAGSLALIACEI